MGLKNRISIWYHVDTIKNMHPGEIAYLILREKEEKGDDYFIDTNHLYLCIENPVYYDRDYVEEILLGGETLIMIERLTRGTSEDSFDIEVIKAGLLYQDHILIRKTLSLESYISFSISGKVDYIGEVCEHEEFQGEIVPDLQNLQKYSLDELRDIYDIFLEEERYKDIQKVLNEIRKREG